MERTENVIYDSYDIYSELYLKDARQQLIDDVFGSSDSLGIKDNFGKVVTVTREEYADKISEEALYNICEDWDRCWFENEQSVMEKLDRKWNEVIAIAGLGLWNGRRTGYKDYRHLQDIMYTSCDYEKIYVDGYGNLRKRESHHDGVNTILYRQWKDDITDIQKDNFRNKCYEGCLTKQDIYRYTKSLGKLFCEYYGW